MIYSNTVTHLKYILFLLRKCYRVTVYHVSISIHFSDYIEDTVTSSYVTVLELIEGSDFWIKKNN